MATSDDLRDLEQTIYVQITQFPLSINDCGKLHDALMPVIRAHSAEVWDDGHRTANPVVPDAHRDVVNPWKQP